MSKKEELKRRRKASDQRRRRRTAVAPDPTACSPRAATGATTDLIASTILDFVDSAGTEVRDLVVVSAIRSSLSATVPASDHARDLLDRLDCAARREQVDTKTFRRGLRELLEVANQHRNSKDSVNFVRYLTLLSQ